MFVRSFTPIQHNVGKSQNGARRQYYYRHQRVRSLGLRCERGEWVQAKAPRPNKRELGPSETQALAPAAPHVLLQIASEAAIPGRLEGGIALKCTTKYLPPTAPIDLWPGSAVPEP